MRKAFGCFGAIFLAVCLVFIAGCVSLSVNANQGGTSFGLGSASVIPPIPITSETYIELARRIRPSIALIASEPLVLIEPGVSGAKEEKEDDECGPRIMSGKYWLPVCVKKELNTRAQGLTQNKLGTGGVVGIKGQKALILTNHHVIEGNQKITVKLNGKEYSAKVVETDAMRDLATLEIEDTTPGHAFSVISFGDSDMVRDGELVMNYGHPFGYEYSVVTGNVSKRLTVPSQGGLFFQLDMTVNGGQSGSPITNLRGEVVGMVRMAHIMYGIGFAIPGNEAKPIILRSLEKL